jgi:hypothetical protein
VLICWFLTVPLVFAADCGRTVSRIEDGFSEGVAAVGDLAVIAAGPRLLVFDLAHPSGAGVVGELRGEGRMTVMAAIDTYVLVAVWTWRGSRVDVIDVAIPDRPAVVSSVPVDRVPLDIVVHGTTAWLLTSASGLAFGLGALDLSDPLHPAVGEFVSLTGLGFTARATVDGDRVYAAIHGSGLHIVDVSNPDTPVEVGYVAYHDAYSVAVEDEIAYLPTILYGSSMHVINVRVVDVSDPASPIVLADASVPIPAVPPFPGDVEIVGDSLYVGIDGLFFWEGGGFNALRLNPWQVDGGLAVFDISDPTTTTFRSVRRFAHGCEMLTHTGERLLAADSDRGLRVFDLTEPDTAPEIVRRNITSNNVYSVAVEGDLAYVGDQGLRIFDLFDPENPELIGAVEHEDETKSVAVGDAGLKILTVGSDGQISVIDGANPFEPIEASRVETDGEAYDVAITGNVGVVADGSAGLLLLDLEDLSFPVVIGRSPTSGAAAAVALWDGLAVVGMADPARGLAVFDITDPTQPTLLAELSMPSDPVAVEVHGDLAAFLTDDIVHVVSLSDPAAPVELSHHEVHWGDGMGLALSETRAMVANYPGNLLYLDLREPAEPERIARHVWMPATIVDGPLLGGWGVDFYNGLGVVADGGFGLRIVDFSRCRRPQRGPAPYSAED